MAGQDPHPLRVRRSARQGRRARNIFSLSLNGGNFPFPPVASAQRFVTFNPEFRPLKGRPLRGQGSRSATPPRPVRLKPPVRWDAPGAQERQKLGSSCPPNPRLGAGLGASPRRGGTAPLGARAGCMTFPSLGLALFARGLAGEATPKRRLAVGKTRRAAHPCTERIRQRKRPPCSERASATRGDAGRGAS